jgi:hypothetical protein
MIKIIIYDYFSPLYKKKTIKLSASKYMKFQQDSLGSAKGGLSGLGIIPQGTIILVSEYVMLIFGSICVLCHTPI